MDRTLWDVVVVGAGPAGSAAALAALRVRPTARVLLLDRADFPRDKPCGDGIAPHALDVLADLGLPGLVDDHRPVHRLHLAVDEGPRVVGDMRRPARVVPRAVLDARIRAGALAAGAVPGTLTVRDVQVGTDEVRLQHGAVRARVVVAADGAQSTVRRALGLARNGPGHLAVAVRGYAPARADLADEQRIVFADDDRPAYAWSFPVGDGRANIGYGEVLRPDRQLTRAHLLHRLDDLLPGATHGVVDVRGHHLPLSSHRPRQPDGRVLLVGDALSLVNPMTGEGLYYAVLSGACAGAAAVGGGAAGDRVVGDEAAGDRVAGDGAAGSKVGDGRARQTDADDDPAREHRSEPDPGRTYRRMLSARLGRHLRHTTAVAALAARVPGVVPAGVRAASADPRVFDDLVELGLGRGLLSRRAALGTARGLLVPRRPAGSDRPGR